MSFHDDKHWQSAFTAVLDVIDLVQGTDEVSSEVKKESMFVLTEIARGISQKRKVDASIVAPVRSLLSVMWAREMLNDDNFAKLDGAFEALANTLPR